MIDRVNIQAFIYTKVPKTAFLLLQRVTSRGGFWQPVSGGIQNNEQPIHAIRREINEETGITEILKIIDLNYSVTFGTSKNNIPMKMKDICFGVEVVDIPTIRLSEEHDIYKWCSMDEVLTHLDWEHNQTAFKKLCSMIGLSM
ncbi:NUDIX hydrolase [Cytobacillus dafuensis]|nr:NUDIX domain-containing protein [Cytobacillus dafuensis]